MKKSWLLFLLITLLFTLNSKTSFAATGTVVINRIGTNGLTIGAPLGAYSGIGAASNKTTNNPATFTGLNAVVYSAFSTDVSGYQQHIYACKYASTSSACALNTAAYKGTPTCHNGYCYISVSVTDGYTNNIFVVYAKNSVYGSVSGSGGVGNGGSISNSSYGDTFWISLFGFTITFSNAGGGIGNDGGAYNDGGVYGSDGVYVGAGAVQTSSVTNGTSAAGGGSATNAGNTTNGTAATQSGNVTQAGTATGDGNVTSVGGATSGGGTTADNSLNTDNNSVVGTPGQPTGEGQLNNGGLVPCGNTAAGQPDCTFSDFKTLFDNIVQFIIYAGIVGSVIIFVELGIEYMRAAGNPAKITKTREKIYVVIVGLLIILGSYLIIKTIVDPLLNTGNGYTNPLK